MSLGLACNFYREPNALPSFIKMATSGYFDDVVMLHAPPSGAKPDDESVALVEKAGLRLVHTTVDEGFGVLRTRCIRESRADWVMILDCDEVFNPMVPLLRCSGTEKYPENKNPSLQVEVVEEAYNQGERLKQIVNHESSHIDALCLSRRHWFCEPGKLERPCQNFTSIVDWQLRLVRNSPFIFYDPKFKMHEKILDSRSWGEPRFVRGDPLRGPFIDHHHCYFKPLEAAQNLEDAKIYEALEKGVVGNMWLNEAEGVAP